jgi:hypothetical protein
MHSPVYCNKKIIQMFRNKKRIVYRRKLMILGFGILEFAAIAQSKNSAISNPASDIKTCIFAALNH